MIAAVLCLLPLAATAQVPDPSTIDQMIEELQLGEAEAAIAMLAAVQPDEAETLYLQSRLFFFRGDYQQALEHAEQAVMRLDSPPPWLVNHRNLVAQTHEVVSGFAEHRTADGRFIIRYDPRVDEVVIPLAEETLARSYVEIGFDFGYWPQEPVRLEIYPRTSTLAAVSTLSVEAIENSGTIALCKYNRLMITSPRALVRGYGWRDTLAHEYVHLVVQHLTGTRVPIWLHEGLAKFEERRWRGPEARDLPPSNQDLLARRIETDDLITFEQMHPSMALLPTQEDSGTAFAEVYTVVEYIHRDHGIEGLRDLVYAIRDGAAVDAAIAQITGQDFQTFVAGWEVYLRGRSYVRLPSEFISSMQFMPDEASEAQPDQLFGIAQEEARDYMRLGELLRGRNRVEASIVEYRKAESLVGQGNPVWQNYLARALLDLGRPEEALEALGEAAFYYPGYYLTFLHQGEAHLQLGEPNVALGHLVEAAGINPFDPEVQRQLSRAYEALGQLELAQQARHFAELTSH